MLRGGRGSGHKVGNLKGRALDTGRRLLRRDGPDGLNLRDIAAEAGAGLGSLYYHFADKDALLAQLALEGFAELSADLDGARANPGAVTPARAACVAFLRFIGREPALYSLMFRERIMSGCGRVRAASTRAFEIFEAAVADSRFAEGEARPIALALWAMVRGMSSMAVSGGGGPDLDSEQMFQDVFHGLTALIGSGVNTPAEQGFAET